MRPDPELTTARPPAASRRARRWLLSLGAAVLGVLLAAPAAHAADRIYWSNYATDSISWADLDGGGAGGSVNTAGATVDGPMGMALDPARGLIYWVNWKGDIGTTISYANLDGSGGGDLAITGATIAGPHGLAIDPDAGPYGTLYWPNHATNSIGWAELDGAGGGAGGDLAITDATVDQPRGMMVDPVTDRVYWSNYAAGLGTSISYADLDGSGDGDAIDVSPDGLGPEGTAIDPATRRVFWSNWGEKHLIQSANLDGTGVSVLATTGATAKGVHGVAIDADAGRVYWANYNSDGIGWANLDGSGGADLDTSGTAIDGPNLPNILKPPVADAAPQVSGGAETGATLSCSTGSWAGDVIEALMYRAPESLSYGWTRDDNELPGAEAATIAATEAGSYRCRVTATNAAGSTGATSAAHAVDEPPPPPPPPPSNAFGFGKLKRDRLHGTAKLAVAVPGPGDVALAGKHLTAVSKHPAAAGEVLLKVRPRGRTKRTLHRRGKATVRPSVTFAPTGGEARTRTKRVELREKRVRR